MSRILALVALLALVSTTLADANILALKHGEIQKINLKKGEPQYFSFRSLNEISTSIGFSRGRQHAVEIYVSASGNGAKVFPGPNKYDFKDVFDGEGIAEVLTKRNTKSYRGESTFVFALIARVDTSLQLYVFDPKTFVKLAGRRKKSSR